MRGSALDELMTVLFLILAIAAFIFFFYNKVVFFWLAGIAIVIRLVQYALRHFN